MNTGYKQATIFYKTTPGGKPVDVDGRLTSVSGKRQAIALLIGYPNPDPTKYEVEIYYDKRENIQGVSSIAYKVESCPVGYIRISPPRIILEAPSISATFTLESTSRWKLISGPTNYVSIDYVSGSAGRYIIKATGIAVGQGKFIFRNELTKQTASIYIINVAGRPWILETGKWNMLGFWYNNGIWKY